MKALIGWVLFPLIAFMLVFGIVGNVVPANECNTILALRVAATNPEAIRLYNPTAGIYVLGAQVSQNWTFAMLTNSATTVQDFFVGTGGKANAVSPATFTQFIDNLKSLGYQSIPIDQLPAGIRNILAESSLGDFLRSIGRWLAGGTAGIAPVGAKMYFRKRKGV